ncbi:energy transducer TonB [Methyloferula stellata]|uniref:energy transducer TonB n=1 Tax=Methyloferula stellata TaxID=876270 RepID=UPI0003657689|nr:TonB family protein [Methyloferula stellata]
MSSALALQSFGFDEFETPVSVLQTGAQTLLLQPRPKPSYAVQAAAVAVYALALTGLAFYSARPTPPVEEDAVELVMLPPAAPEEQPAPLPEPPPPPVAEETPQPPEPEMAPPPPVAEEPAVAPVEPPKPKPVPQPKPKVVEHKPAPVQHAAGPSTAQAPAKVPPNAIASGYANQVHARIAAAAAAVVPRAALAAHQSGRVGYRIVISPSGAVVSQSITPSGNPAFDTAATQALARASFPATGMTRNASLTGAIVFR